jgi:hypothetical protein
MSSGRLLHEHAALELPLPRPAHKQLIAARRQRAINDTKVLLGALNRARQAHLKASLAAAAV